MSFIQKAERKLLGDDSQREVKHKELLRYSLGVWGQNNCYCLISTWFLFFCTDVLYLDVLAIGTVLALARVWDSINDPIVGIIVDRHTFKNGEKMRPYLKIMAIPTAIFAALLFIDVGLNSSRMVIYVAVVYFLWDLLYSFQDIAQWGMVAMISTHSEERGRAAQYARIAGSIGGWLPGLLTVVLGFAGNLGISPKIIFAVSGVLFGFGGMVLSMFTHSARERIPVSKPQGSVLEDLKLLFKNKIVILLVIANVLSSCTLVIPGIYFFKYMVTINLFGQEINGLTVSFIYGILVGIPGTLAIFATTWFAKRIGGMRNVLVLSTIMNIALRILAFFIGYEGYKIIIMGVLMSLVGIPSGMNGIASTTLWADSIDYIEWKEGKRNEGLVFSMQNFIAKITTAISTFFSGLTLTLLAFDAKLYDLGLPQNPVFYKWVWPVYMLAPALGSILYLIPLLMVKDNRKEHEMIETELKKRRAIAAGIIVGEDKSRYLIDGINIYD